MLGYQIGYTVSEYSRLSVQYTTVRTSHKVIWCIHIDCVYMRQVCNKIAHTLRSLQTCLMACGPQTSKMTRDWTWSDRCSCVERIVENAGTTVRIGSQLETKLVQLKRRNYAQCVKDEAVRAHICELWWMSTSS